MLRIAIPNKGRLNQDARSLLSDAGLDVSKQNAFNFYKDKLRTFEVLARQRLNKGLKARR